MSDVARRLARVLLQVIWPVRHAESVSGWVQLFVLAGLSAGAVSFLRESPFAIIVYVLLVLLALTFAAAYRLQGRADAAYTRQELIDARNALGLLVGDAGDLLLGATGDEPFAEQVSNISGLCMELFQTDTVVFDHSHEGRLYAARTASFRRANVEGDEALRDELEAVIGCLDDFIKEINAELISFPK